MAAKQRDAQWWLPWVLAVAVFALFAQAAGNGFVNFDDDAYILNNPHVNGGLTPANVYWALTSVDYFYWQPLTWLSHQIDVSLFGLASGPMHIESALLHAVNAWLLVALLRRFGACTVLAVAGAALWALHPLRVESVVWAAERKDVLSLLFGLLATLAYVDRKAGWRVALLFAAGLAAKPGLVILPVVFLLIDEFHLKRRAFVEKWPLFAMAGVVALLTVKGQNAHGATAALGDLDLTTRLAQALTNSALYLWRTLWPAGLSVLYPYDARLAVWKPAVAALVIGCLSVAAWRWRARHAGGALGWFWYLACLAPVSGIIQAGPQAGADRFTYLPAVGLSLAAVGLWPRLKAPALAAAAVLAYVAYIQIGHWRDSVSLFTHANAVTRNNWIALRNLGNGLVAAGDSAGGIARFQGSLAIEPRQVETNYQLGSAIAGQGKWAEALPYFEAALKLKPDYGSAQYAAAVGLARTGRETEAMAAFARALELPLEARFQAEAHNALGALYGMRGDRASAERHLREAVKLNPSFQPAQENLRRLLGSGGAR